MFSESSCAHKKLRLPGEQRVHRYAGCKSMNLCLSACKHNPNNFGVEKSQIERDHKSSSFLGKVTALSSERAGSVAIMEETEESKSTINQSQEEQRVWSWGAGTDGQLGTGRLEDEHSPQLLHLRFLSSVGPISMLACGGAHVLALASDGTVFSWGRGTSGQLGSGEMANSLYPKPVAFPDNSISHYITYISAGWSHSGFVSDSGFLYTCGDGSFGQLGHGDHRSHCSPIKVSYFVNNHVGQIACGMRHSLVLLKDGSESQIYGFGAGKRGQLGISKDKIRSVNLPQVVNGFEEVEIAAISANGDHSAALSNDGRLYTWGKGFSSTSDANIPQCLPSTERFTRAVLGWNHALLFTGGEEVFMLGGTHHGVLSDPEKMSPAKRLTENSDEAALEKVSGIEGVKVIQIAAGAEHSALVTDNGEIMTWGWGEHGQLGLGSTCDQTKPTAVCLGDEVRNKNTLFQVFCGSGFTYAVGTVTLPS